MNPNAQKRDEFVRQLRDYQQKVSTWIASIWYSPPEDDFTKSEDYQIALDYYRNFQQVEGVDYREVISYAKELYSRHLDTDRLLDEKADSIIKYLGGGSTLITFGAILSIKLDSPKTIELGLVALVAILPCLVLAVLAVSKALKARKPRASALPPNVKFAVDLAEYNETQEKTALNLWLMFHPICEAALYRNLQKSKYVNSAHCFYKWFIISLILPVLGMAIYLKWFT